MAEEIDANVPVGNAPGPTTGTGHVLLPGPLGRIVQPPRIDSRSAVAEALREYLRCATFNVWGDKAPDRAFKLTRVDRQWPEPSQGLDVPLAVVLDPSSVLQDDWSLSPCPLEDTFEVFGPCTVLWKTAEVVATLQLDFWLANDPEREAVAALLPSLFAPEEDSWGVFVQAPDTYFCRPVRLSLMDFQRMDDAASIYPRERRLRCTVKAETDEVHLRTIKLTQIVAQLLPGDPDADPCDVPT